MVGAIALYFVVWWTLLFAVLPLRNQAGDATRAAWCRARTPARPAPPRLREKAIWTTLVAGAAFLVALAVFPLTGL